MRLSIIQVLALLVFSSSLAFSQAWTWQNPLPNGNPLSSVYWIDQNTAWAVGALGNAVRTTDGGTTWSVQSISPGTALSRVIFTSPQKGWAIGAGVAMMTTDGGTTWSAANTGQPNTVSFNAIAWAGSNTGWIAGSGGLIIHTIDGGGTWTRQNSPTNQQFNGMGFINATTGYVCGTSGTVMKTTDGGSLWSKLTSAIIGTTVTFHDIAAIDEYNAVVVGDGGKICATRDRGVTWIALSSGTNQNLNGVCFTGFNNGVIVGNNGFVRYTQNGGGAWQGVFTLSTENFNGVHFANAQRWMVVGNACRIAVSNDAALTWSMKTTGPASEFLDVDFVDSLNGWTVGRNNQIWHTGDGGITWSNQTPPNSYHNINGLSVVSKLIAFAVGDSTYILHTTNGGSTWNTENLPSQIAAKTNLYGVKFTDASNGWICGANGTYVFHTINGGALWTIVYTNIADKNITLRRLSVVGVDVCAVGTNGAIYHTFNGGTSWSKQNSNTTQLLTGVSFATSALGLASGNGGTVLATTNGGTTWTPDSAVTQQNVSTVILLADASARACGTGGLLMRSTDNGITWIFDQPQPTRNNINSIATPTSRIAFAVGQSGTILKSFAPRSAISTSFRTLHFDSLDVGSCDSINVSVYNVGDTAVDINAITISSTDSTLYSLAVPGPLPVTIPKGKSYTFAVKFCSHDTGYSFGIITILNTSPVSWLTIPVDAYAGTLTFTSPDTLDFHHVAVSDEFDTSGYIINTGVIPLRLKSLSIIGPDSQMFIYNGLINGQFPSTTIASGESLRVQFNLYPTAPGPLSATAVFATNSSIPLTIFLHANDIVGVAERPQLPRDGRMNISISPIPMRDHGVVTINAIDNEPATLTLSDVLGRTVWEQHVMLTGTAVSTGMHLDIGAGMYILNVRIQHGVATHPVMVVR